MLYDEETLKYLRIFLVLLYSLFACDYGNIPKTHGIRDRQVALWGDALREDSRLVRVRRHCG